MPWRFGSESVLLLACALALFSSCNTQRAEEEDQAAAKRMNVLFIALDDMNDWISLLDSNAPIRTPNLERLARKGMLFTQAYCPSPACNPSRAAILSGRMPSSTGVYGNATDWKVALAGGRTLPRFFMEQGYRSEGAGKIFHHHMNGAFHDTAAFHEFRQMPWPPDAPMPKKKLNGLQWYGTANTDWGIWPAEDSLHVDARTVSYVSEKLGGNYEQPFFLAAGIFRPHMPFFAPAEYFEKYPLESLRMPAVFEDDMKDIPPGGMKLWDETRWFFDGITKAEQQEPGTWKKAVQAYQASASFADAQVGAILDALEKSAYADNTIIVLWSDHGYHLGEKQHWEKFALWEKTTHVPFIIVAPGITAPGSVCRRPVSLIDIYPTLAELCGLDIPEGLDGQSLLPLLKEPEADWRPALMTYGQGNHALRSGKWRYIRYADGSEELYDQERDPHNWYNLSDEPAHAELLAGLRQQLPGTEAPPRPDLRRSGKGGRRSGNGEK